MRHLKRGRFGSRRKGLCVSHPSYRLWSHRNGTVRTDQGDADFVLARSDSNCHRIMVPRIRVRKTEWILRVSLKFPTVERSIVCIDEKLRSQTRHRNRRLGFLRCFRAFGRGAGFDAAGWSIEVETGLE